MGIRVSWDPAKSSANLPKHGTAFAEAVGAFGDPLSLTRADPDHSAFELRYILIGTTPRGRLIVIAHADRGDEIRIISARPATRRERHAYEEEP
jgi:uncharacterized DUF497 family protein